ncbi:MAG: hypothetical protein ACREFX_10645 [Opitutaceae bacterium]
MRRPALARPPVPGAEFRTGNPGIAMRTFRITAPLGGDHYPERGIRSTP